jgi:hypothetical protein
MIAAPSPQTALESPSKTILPPESQVANMKRRRAEKRRQVRLRRLKGLFRLLVFCVLVYGIITFIQQPFWTFKPSNVSIVGNNLVPKQGILPFVQPYDGIPLYKISPGEIIQNVRQRYPIVDNMVVRRLLLPTRIELMLTEKTPWAAVYFQMPPLDTLPTLAPKDDTKVLTTEQKLTLRSPEALMTTDSQFIDVKAYPNPEILQQKAKELPKVFIHPSLETSKVLNKTFYQQLNVLTHQLTAIPGLTLHYLWIPSPTNISAHFAEVDVLIGALDRTTTDRVERLLLLKQSVAGMKEQIQWVDVRWRKQLTLHKKIHPTHSGTPDITSSN